MKRNNRESERGSANTKLLIFLLVAALGINAGINYVPVAFTGESVKQDMHKAVMQGMSMQVTGKTPVDLTKDKINQALTANGIENAVVLVRSANNTISATVKYSVEVPILPFGIYKRTYEFDHTESPASFLSK